MESKYESRSRCKSAAALEIFWCTITGPALFFRPPGSLSWPSCGGLLAAPRAAFACARALLAAACARARGSLMPWLPTGLPGLTVWEPYCTHTHLMLRGRPRAHGGALSLPPGSTVLCACGGADSVTAVLPLRQAFAPPTPLCNPRRSRVEKLDSVQTTTLQAMTLCAERLWRATSPLRRPVYTISW